MADRIWQLRLPGGSVFWAGSTDASRIARSASPFADAVETPVGGAAIEFTAGVVSAISVDAAAIEFTGGVVSAISVDAAAIECTAGVVSAISVDAAAIEFTGGVVSAISVDAAAIEFTAGVVSVVDPPLPPLPRPPRRPLPVVLVEIGTPTGVRWFSDGRYVDVVEGVIAEARLGKRISFERSITTIFWGGGTARTKIGDIEFINLDGGLDQLVYQGLRNELIRIYIGDDETAIADMTLAAVAIVEDIETVGEQAIRIVTAGRDALLSKSILTSTFSSGDQLGRLVPRNYGRSFNVPALPSDIANLRFAVHDTGSNAILGVYDRGAALTPTTQWLPYNTAPTFGFRLLDATVGRITADCDGAQPDFGYHIATLPNVMRSLLDDAGWTAYSTTTITDLHTSLGGAMRFGLFVDGAMTYKQALDELCDSFGGFWYVDHLGEFRSAALELPSGPQVLALTHTELASEVTVSFDDAPGLSTTVAGIRNWHVHNTDELAGSVRDTSFGISLTLDYRERLSFDVHAAYGGAIGRVGGVRDSARSTVDRVDPQPGSGARRVRSDQGHGTLISNSGSLEAERDRRAALWDSPRYWYKCKAQLLRTQAAALDPNDVVSLTVPIRGGGYRYGLNAHLVRVVGVRGEFGSSEVELTLWGGAPT